MLLPPSTINASTSARVGQGRSVGAVVLGRKTHCPGYRMLDIAFEITCQKSGHTGIAAAERINGLDLVRSVMKKCPPAYASEVNVEPVEQRVTCALSQAQL